MRNTSQAVDHNHFKPWRAFQNHALNLLELLKAVSETDHDIARRVTVHGAGHIDEALAKGRGLILTTMHSGNWELGAAALALKGHPITTVAGTQLREGWSDAVKAFKRRFGMSVISPQNSMRTLYRVLGDNRIVVLQIDGDVFRGGLDATLLGRRVSVPRGPAHLSRVLGAPTAFAYCRRAHGSSLEIHIEPPISPPMNAEDEIRVTHAHVASLEKCILDEPGQWCIFRRL